MPEGDAELLSACVRGEPRAWSRLVDRYSALVYSIPRKQGLPESDCDDVFQTVFSSLLTHIGSIRDAASLPKWLITSTRRECWRVARARAPVALPDDPPDAAVSEAETMETLERRQIVRESLRELGGSCERLLRALFASRAERSYADIARELGLPVGSIGPTRARCLSKLMEILGRRLGDENGAESQDTLRI